MRKQVKTERFGNERKLAEFLNEKEERFCVGIAYRGGRELFPYVLWYTDE